MKLQELDKTRNLTNINVVRIHRGYSKNRRVHDIYMNCIIRRFGYNREELWNLTKSLTEIRPPSPHSIVCHSSENQTGIKMLMKCNNVLGLFDVVSENVCFYKTFNFEHLTKEFVCIGGRISHYEYNECLITNSSFVWSERFNAGHSLINVLKAWLASRRKKSECLEQVRNKYFS